MDSHCKIIDNKGATIVLMRVANKQIIGVYKPVLWQVDYLNCQNYLIHHLNLQIGNNIFSKGKIKKIYIFLRTPINEIELQNSNM